MCNGCGCGVHVTGICTICENISVCNKVNKVRVDGFVILVAIKVCACVVCLGVCSRFVRSGFECSALAITHMPEKENIS